MAITTVFSKQSPSIGGLIFDATLEESVTATSESTDFTVEDGSVYQDHIINMPEVITMTVSTSDTPFLGLLGTAAATLGGGVASKFPPAVAAVAGVAGELINSAYNAGSLDTRSSAAWNTLFDARAKKSVFDVQTSKRIYENCHITSLYHKTNPENEGGIDIVVEMKAIKTYKTKLSGSQPSKDQLRQGDTASIQAAPEANLGEVSLAEI